MVGFWTDVTLVDIILENRKESAERDDGFSRHILLYTNICILTETSISGILNWRNLGGQHPGEPEGERGAGGGSFKTHITVLKYL